MCLREGGYWGLPMRAIALGCAAALVGVLVASLAGCASTSADDAISDVSQGTAATVNGKPVGEKAITDYVATFRSTNALDSTESWGQWLATNEQTPESVRADVIDYYVDELLVRQAAQESDVAVDASEIDAEIDEAKSRFTDENAWASALEQSGLTEETYRETIVEPGLLRQKLQEKVAPGADVSDEAVAQGISENAERYDGARRSSHILFAPGDEAKAQEVLDKITSGELDFADAAKEYSTDAVSAERGGDVGYDVLTTFVDEYADSLSALNEGEVSGLVTSQYGIHIIMCTDIVSIPEEGVSSLDGIPSEIVDHVRMTLSATDSDTAFLAWFDEYRAAADIVVNDMPEDLPYDIDMSPYQQQDLGLPAEGVTDGPEDSGALGATSQGSEPGASDGSGEAPADGEDRPDGSAAEADGE
ncbi:hypothetical protein B5F40_09040 [Gordonibacter sp. An230]|uniref:peptidylprolyl isomerase n=1 Tax=Gordonibacter sp. An230 TaxID=1965592 RepID=UPI000B373B51|nr:peptidylprolyl isomerase [Gordonibacter sp. An230]OUO89967.1 hypothetical protein B5F40_09040 [Gordonibacter sp. An230]